MLILKNNKCKHNETRLLELIYFYIKLQQIINNLNSIETSLNFQIKI